jgi:2-dehydropantoate 2-reductase
LGKWVFIAAAGIITYLFRRSVEKIIDAGGLPQIIAVITEAEAVAAAAEPPVSQQSRTQSLGLLTEAGSGFTSSLCRDLTAGLPTEAAHILGVLARHEHHCGVATSLLDLALIEIRTNS